MSPSRGPRPAALSLTQAERQALETFVHRPSTPQQLALRGRLVLAAADGLNNTQIARHFGVNAEMARRWRTRWLATSPADPDVPPAVAARLGDAPRPGTPAHFTAEQFCQRVALACEIPEGSERPISQWSRREIAAEAIKRGIFVAISPRHVGRFLTGGGPQTPPDPLLADAASQRTGGATPEQDRRHLHALPRGAPPCRRGRTDDEHG